MMMQKPYAPSCDRNQSVILSQLLPYLSQSRHCLEIGSGTGQHAVHFAEQLPSLIWQCSDLAENLQGISQWIEESQLTNIPKPIALNALTPWPKQLNQQFDCAFTANTLHIMSCDAAEQLFLKLRSVIKNGGQLFIYGPFNVNGQFTSDSNAQFEEWLKTRNPKSGIRDLEWIETLANRHAFTLKTVSELPANNKLLHFIC